MPFPELDFVSALTGPSLEEQPPAKSPKAGLWDLASGVDGLADTDRPHFPTSVRIAALGPAAVAKSRSGQGILYEATIEVETEPWQTGGASASQAAATHYVLTVSVASVGDEDVNRHEVTGLRHHCKSIVPFARCTSFAVTGLSPGTLYEFDVCTANASGSSEVVQVHVLTPSPSSSTTSPQVATSASSSQPPLASHSDDEDFFDAEEHCDVRSHASNEEFRTLEELLEDDRCFQECLEPAPDKDPPVPSAKPRAMSTEQLGQTAKEADTRALLFPGLVWAAGFQINEKQLTLGHEPADVECAVGQLQAICVSPWRIRPQQALRMALGMGLDVAAAEAKWDQIAMWRAEYRMEEERARAEQLQSDRSKPVTFPHHDEVCEKLLMISPCALVTTSGFPVSVWHIGSLNAQTATKVPIDHIDAWSRGFFEYLDVWLTEESDRSSLLLGHIHVFDLQGLSWWHLMSGELLERGRAAMHAGEFYIENCYDVYAINASTIFNAVWRLLQRFLSARAAAKIIVDSGVPNELLTALGPMAWERLQGVLQAPANRTRPPILRPPRHGGRHALL